MVREGSIAVTWSEREPPLAPSGVVARAAAAVKLARRLIADGDRGTLRGVAGERLLAVFGSPLPWVDGVTYVGLEAGLYMPTTLRPNAPSRLVARALSRLHGGSTWVVLPPALAFSAGEARPNAAD
jgi:hypothetical protein